MNSRIATDTTAHPDWSRRDFGLMLALLVLTAAPYVQVAWFDVVRYDDPKYLSEADLVPRGLEPFALWDALAGFHFDNWHPLTWWSLMFDRQLFGMNPAAFHLMNLGWHLANTALCFVALFELTGDRWRSAAVALAFGIHPLHVETVAWISERKGVLSGLFWMLALWSYAHWARTGRRSWWTCTTVWLALGLMSKQVLVTFPLVCLLLDAWPLGRWVDPRLNRPTWQRAWRLVVEKLPWFVLIALGCWLAIEAQQEAKGSQLYFPRSLRAANATLNGVRYLSKTFWPVGLAVQYPFNTPQSLAPVLAAATVLATITTAALLYSRRNPAVLVGWLWYGVTLLPMIGLLQVGKQSMADRYMYLPLIGLAISVAWLIPPPRSRAAVLSYALAAIAAFGTLEWRTAQQTAVWRDTFTLFAHAAAVDPTNDDALFQLGSMALNDGRIDEGLAYLNDGVRWNRYRWNARAAWAADRSAMLSAQLQRQWADVSFTMAQAEAARGNPAAAIPHLQDAVNFDETHHEARLLLGRLLLDSGQPAAAMHELDQLLKRQPDHPRAAAIREQARQRLPPTTTPRSEP